MKRIFCIFLTCLCLIGMMPLQADALDAQRPLSPAEIQNAPVMEFDFSEYLQLPMFSGIATMDVGDNEFNEMEPNDTPEDANAIYPDYTVYASLSESDILDVYAITLPSDSEIVLVSVADTATLIWGLLDEQGELLATSEELDGAEGYYADGIGGILAAGTYYFAAVDENAGAAEYMFYFEVQPYTSESQVELFTEREWEVLKLTNQERLQMGLDPLTGFAKLQEASSIRAEEITQYFSHTRPDGTSCFTIADEVGLHYYSMGENIATGYTTPDWVVDAWMNSDGHCANILNVGYSHLGVGEINNSWVQLFVGGGGYYTSISVVPAKSTVAVGTSIDDMDLVAVLNHSVYGECYLPVDVSYCQGYNPHVSGTQTVTISVLGVSSTFEIHVKEHDHVWLDATCTSPKTCAVCGTTEGTAPGHSWKEATCTSSKTCAVCGFMEGAVLGHKYVDGVCAICGHKENELDTVPMYRLYNPYTLEHLLTADAAERDLLVSAGWSLDGVAWNSPDEGTPVYRLYNPYDDWHTYSMNQEEIDILVPLGWKVDGVVCRSATKENGKPVYRLFNPYEQKNYHLLTASEDECEFLMGLGWTLDGAAWFCMAD